MGRLFPRQFDNDYRGLRTGLWLLVAVLALKALQGANSMFDPVRIMTSADGIAVQTYPPEIAATAIQMFALLGLWLLVLPLIGIVALIRYRAMIPFVYLMLLFQQIGARALHYVYPDDRAAGTPIGVFVNLVILGVTVLGFALSLIPRARAAATAGAE